MERLLPLVDDTTRSVAVHEAGHAVVCLALGGRCKAAVVGVQPDGSPGGGHVRISGLRDDDRLACYHGGHVAEYFSGSVDMTAAQPGVATDRRLMADITADEGRIAAAEKVARMILARQTPAVNAIAQHIGRWGSADESKRRFQKGWRVVAWGDEP